MDGGFKPLLFAIHDLSEECPFLLGCTLIPALARAAIRFLDTSSTVIPGLTNVSSRRSGWGFVMTFPLYLVEAKVISPYGEYPEFP